MIFHLALSVMQSHVLDKAVPSATELEAVMGFAFRAMYKPERSPRTRQAVGRGRELPG